MKVSKRWSDHEIIQGILTGGRAEEDAIKAIYDNHRSVLCRYVGNKSSKTYAKEPEDIIWESIEALVNNVKEGKYQPQAGTNIEAYIKMICKNLWHKYLASETARESRQEGYVGLDDDKTDLDISEIMSRIETWDSYLSIFERVGKNCKEILSLTFADDVPMNELAKMMVATGKYENEQTVRNAKSKCLKKVLLEIGYSK